MSHQSCQLSQISQPFGLFFLEVVYVIDSSLVNPEAPEEKVWRCEVWRPGGPGSRASPSNPRNPKSGVKISPGVPGPVWRGSILLQHLVWDVSNCQLRTFAACPDNWPHSRLDLSKIGAKTPETCTKQQTSNLVDTRGFSNRSWGFSVPHILQFCLFSTPHLTLVASSH